MPTLKVPCRAFGRIAVFTLLISTTAGATSVSRLSFEQLTDQSDLIVSGQITRTWSEWDSGHKYIWTHNELTVTSTLKGSAGSTVVVSEPGGVVGLVGMTIAGTSVYRAGDNVVLFLSRMPNGFLRTTGWGQGKYTIDSGGRLHGDASLSALEVAGGKSTTTGTSLVSLNGMTVPGLAARVAARVRAVRAQ